MHQRGLTIRHAQIQLQEAWPSHKRQDFPGKNVNKTLLRERANHRTPSTWNELTRTGHMIEFMRRYWGTGFTSQYWLRGSLFIDTSRTTSRPVTFTDSLGYWLSQCQITLRYACDRDPLRCDPGPFPSVRAHHAGCRPRGRHDGVEMALAAILKQHGGPIYISFHTAC